MHFHFRNVNDAFKGLVSGIHQGSIPTHKSPSRVGEVLMVEEPATITYTHPKERVLFNQARDCNPFFHLFEALWMLAGRNDVEPLMYYNPRMLEYSDNGQTLHGAYGHRWRSYFRLGHPPTILDQVREVCEELKKDPTSRRCVLQMWSSIADLGVRTKDKPCNTHIYFFQDGVKRLGMTVCNRSNDLIWGMLGANFVHFSILQEYMAACIGWEMGRYHQMTNNLHVYTERWQPEEWLAPDFVTYSESPQSIPLVQDPKRFDQECAAFVDSIDGDYTEPFLRQVAQPMCAAFRRHKQRCYQGDDNALAIVDRVWADDWRWAGHDWIAKRKRNWDRESNDGSNPYTKRELPRQSASGAIVSLI